MGAFRRDLKVARAESLRTSQFMAKNFDAVKGAMIGLAGVAGIGMVAKSIIRMGMEFQQSMAVVRGVTRATEKEFQNIAKKLGETTEWTASQAADALKFLGMAGFSASKAMAALPGTLDLATAGNIALGQAADIATNALTAMQLEVGELGRVNDVFVGTITRSNTNMEMMAESFRYAAPVAKAYGISIERLSALIGTLGNAGIQGSMAGTQLAFGFQKAARVFKELGIDGTGKDMVDALEAANKAGWDSAKMMQGLRWF
jgi:TP901 family phage tail tape measure protein